MAISTSAATTQQPSVAATLRDLIQGYWATQAVYAAAKLGIADLLRDGPQHPDALARVAGAYPSALVRVLRLLASHDLFAKDADGRFSLTPAAALLQTVSPNSLHAFALSPQLWWRSVGDLLYSVQTGDPAFCDRGKTKVASIETRLVNRLLAARRRSAPSRADALGSGSCLPARWCSTARSPSTTSSLRYACT
jgi:Dimerisation domain